MSIIANKTSGDRLALDLVWTVKPVNTFVPTDEHTGCAVKIAGFDTTERLIEVDLAGPSDTAFADIVARESGDAMATDVKDKLKVALYGVPRKCRAGGTVTRGTFVKRVAGGKYVNAVATDTAQLLALTSAADTQAFIGLPMGTHDVV